MTGLSLFLAGAVAVSNLGFLAYLLLDRNRRIQPPADKPPEDRPDAPVKPQNTESPLPRSLVGKSKFNIDDDEDIESRIDRLVDNAFDRNIMRVRKSMLGDVCLRDVEFDNEDPSAPAIEEKLSAAYVPHMPPAKYQRMRPEQEASAFDDVRIEDVEPDTVSPPSATGATMDDIAESIETAMNPDATAEQKTKAGNVLDPLADTNLMDGLLSYDQIAEGIKSCMTELLRSDIADKTARKAAKASKDSKPPTVRSNPEAKAPAFRIAGNIDDFDPADLLK